MDACNGAEHHFTLVPPDQSGAYLHGDQTQQRKREGGTIVIWGWGGGGGGGFVCVRVCVCLCVWEGGIITLIKYILPQAAPAF